MRQSLDDAILDEGPFLRAAIRMMLTGLAVMLAALFSLYFLPMHLAPFVSFGLYALLIGLEIHHRVISTVTLLMLVCYAALAAARVLTTDIAWSAYAAPLVYFLLAALVLGLLASGRPFTLVYAKGAGYLPLHRAMSLMWGCLHLLAGLAAVSLMPSLTFLIVPMALMVVGALGTLVLNFVTMGPAHGRQKVFARAGFNYRQAVSPKELDLFYATIAEAYRSDLQRAAGPKRRIDPATIEAKHRETDAKRDGHAMAFLVCDGETAVGGICMFLDHASQGLPIEREASISADAYRARGAVVEFCRLGILPRYRLERSVLSGLFKCVIEAAIERRVHTILNNSALWQTNLYSKIGFAGITDNPYRCSDDGVGFGLQAQPLALDLARMVRLEQQTTTGADVRNLLQPYVVERFFKILAVQDMIRAVLPRKIHVYGTVPPAT